MKLVLFAVAAIIATIGSASAQYVQPYGAGAHGTGSNPLSVYHQGYTTQSGTYVRPHYQTAPNNTQMDNYSTRANVNPYTGSYGHRSPRW